MALAAIATLGSTSPARADQLIETKVPFDFIVHDTRMPAGDYVIRIRDASSGIQPVLVVESADGRRTALVMTFSDESSGPDFAAPEVSFQTYRHEHFLARVDPHRGGAHEVALTPAIMEKELLEADERGR